MNVYSLNLISIIFIFSNLPIKAQPADTIYGKVKSIREKIEFLDEERQNYNLAGLYGDYGHSGWKPELGKNSRFNIWWYNTPLVHYINYYKEFDEEGNITLIEWYFKNQNLVNRKENTYNELGDLIHQKITDNQFGERINDYDEYSRLYSYDQHKNMIHLKTTFSDNSFSVNSKSYDSLNNLKKELYYRSKSPKEVNYSKYFYDENSNLIEIKRFDEDGERNGKKYEYDKKNRRVKIIFHYPFKWVRTENHTNQKRTKNGSDFLYKVFKYDSKNRIVETKTYNQSLYTYDKVEISDVERKIFKGDLIKKIMHYDKKDSLKYFEEYTYDSHNRMIKKVVSSSHQNEPTLKLKYTYNEHDFPTKLIYIENGKKTEIDFEYEFDSNNNWIKQTKTINGEKLYNWIRKIEYYK